MEYPFTIGGRSKLVVWDMGKFDEILSLVRRCSVSLFNGGEIFVFDMGQLVKIADLAKRMIALSNAKNVEIKYTGLREGEKLYEEVLNEMEGTKPTFHEKIRIAQVREYDYDEVAKEVDELVDIAKKFDNMDTVRKMKEIVPEYKSNNSVYEVLDKATREN